MAEGGEDNAGLVSQTADNEARIPSTFSQLLNIANQPPPSQNSVWGDPLSHDGRPPSVPPTIAAAASRNDDPAPMGAVKSVQVATRHQVETLVPTEHYEITTTLPFVKPAEIAAALIAAKLLTTNEWTNQACHYQYENNFVHYISIPAARHGRFDVLEENGVEIPGSRNSQRNGIEDFTMTISKPGRSSANATLKNVPVTMTKEALIDTLQSIEGVNVKAATKSQKCPSQWSLKLQGPGIKDLHVIRLRNIVRNQPSMFVDALLLIPGRKIACKHCGADDHAFWKCPNKVQSGPKPRPRREQQLIEEELTRLAGEQLFRHNDDVLRNNRFYVLSSENDDPNASEDESTDTETEKPASEQPAERRKRKTSQRKKKHANPKKKKRSKKDLANLKDNHKNGDKSATEMETDATSQVEEDADGQENEEELTNLKTGAYKIAGYTRPIPGVLSHITQTVTHLAQGVTPERLSSEAQNLLRQGNDEPEAESDHFTPDGYSRQQLGDQPLVIDMSLARDLERAMDEVSESGEGTGASLYHTVSPIDKDTQPTIRAEDEEDATGGDGVVTSTPMGKSKSWAATSPDATIEPAEASKALEGNFEGRTPRFVQSKKTPSMSPINGRKSTNNKSKERQIPVPESPASRSGARAKSGSKPPTESPTAPPRKSPFTRTQAQQRPAASRTARD